MLFGINGAEFLVLLAVAVIVVGPERLPRYAEQLAHAVRKLRAFLGDAKERVADELGDDVKDVDWEALDPRRYDPRRIVREALLDPEPAAPVTAAASGAAVYVSGTRPASSVQSASVRRREDDLAVAESGAPFDDEAT
ncbi:MAG: Sec-independent protein translocase TatB [Actinomycetota bacterium]|nr:Sec-independent protein translocase TatB [Actinomycetota bacterium]